MDKIRVLVVDDSMVSHAVLEQLLVQSDFEICGNAMNCAEAIEKYRELSPDVVTMDMNLPDGNGMDCSQRIFEIDPKAKIVMISAMKDARLIVQGHAIGISSFLQKPLSASDLIMTLQMVCIRKGSVADALKNSYVNLFVDALRDNLFKLAGLHSNAEVTRDEGSCLDIGGIAVIIGLTGSPAGRVIFHMEESLTEKFSRIMLRADERRALTDAEVVDSIEETANIVAGSAVSMINDVFKNKEIRVTPPGTIRGNRVKIANPKLISFNIVVHTRLGDFKMNVGFTGGE